MSLLNMLLENVMGSPAKQMSKRVGAKDDVVNQVIQEALPLLMGAMANNSNDSKGASSLDRALEKDHDGGILDDLAGFLGNADTSMGDGIVKHVLGGRRGAVEKTLSKRSGLDAQSVGQIVSMLAPVVMAQLGKQTRQDGLDANGLASLLSGERKRVERKAPGAMGMLAGLLDDDGDGDITDEVMGIGANLLGGLFGGKK
jgi:hypothetical protein